MDIDHRDRKIILGAQAASNITCGEESLKVLEEQLETSYTPIVSHVVLDEDVEGTTMRMTTFAQTPQKFHLTTLDETNTPSKLKAREYMTLRFYTRKSGHTRDAAVFKPWTSLLRSRKDPNFCLWFHSRYLSTGAPEWYEGSNGIETANDMETSTLPMPPDKNAAVKAWRAQMLHEADLNGRNMAESLGSPGFAAQDLEAITSGIEVRSACTDQALTISHIQKPSASIEGLSSKTIKPRVSSARRNIAQGSIVYTASDRAFSHKQPLIVVCKKRSESAEENIQDADTGNRYFIPRNDASKTDDRPVPMSQVETQDDFSRVERSQRNLHASSNRSSNRGASIGILPGGYRSDLLEDSPEDDRISLSLYHPLIPTTPLGPSISTRHASPNLVQEESRAENSSNKDHSASECPQADIVESRQQVSEVATRKFRSTMRQRGPSNREIASKENLENFSDSTNDSVIEMIRKGKKYRGELKLQIDLGRILVFRCPVEASGNYVGQTEMLRMLNQQSLTSFTSM